MSANTPANTNSVRYGQVNRSYGMQLATTAPEEDGPVWMINLMKYREIADYGDGRTGVSGRAADDEYAPLGPLKAIGAEVVFVADVDTQLLGAEPTWDRIGVVKYPTRRAFIEMQSRPDFKEKHVHKDAGMAQTIVMGGLPVALPPMPFEPPTWDSVPHPPTDADGPVVVMHVIRFNEGAAETTMRSYQEAAALAAIPQGLRIDGWFRVEGTIVGDGRTWDEVRFNAFPSRAAFMAVAMDPNRVSAQKDFREPAIADTYALILRASINRLAESAS